MVAARSHLAILVLALGVCFARFDTQKLSAVTYTDCFGGNSQLTVSNVILSPSSPQPIEQVYLTFNVTNPSTGTDVAVNYIYWTVNFTTPVTGNQTRYGYVVRAGTTDGPLWVGSGLHQIYSSGSIPFQVVLYSNYYTEVACWAGSVDVTAPLNPSDCLGGDSQLSLRESILHLNVTQYNQSFYLTFKIDDDLDSNVSFNIIYSTIFFNGVTPISYNQNFSAPVIVTTWGSIDLRSPDVWLTQNRNISWYEYYFQFYDDGNPVACWNGYQIVNPPPPNPYDCFGGKTQLSFRNAILHPSSPQINDSFYLTFEVENQSDKNVTFNDIYWTLTFNTSSSIAYNATLWNILLAPGQFIGLTTNEVTLNQSVSPGAYPYQFVFYSKFTTEIACWGGNVTIPNQGDCLSGGSQLIVANVILNPNSPQINDPVNLTFTIENESGGNVAFNDIYWTLTFDPSSPLSYNQTLGGYVSLTNGTSLTLNGNSLTLNESVSAGAYPYQLEFYDNATKIACWVGEVVVPAPNPSSSIYFLEDYRTEHPFMS